MIDLSRHIEYLLLHNDKVEVPSLGTFMAEYVESKWIEEENLFLPPYRSVLYKQEVENGDAFLKSLSIQYNISMSEAGILCLEFTENILQELYDNGTADIGGIGYFIQENENDKRVFVPCEAGVASPSLYGLDSIYISPYNSKHTDTDIITNKHVRKLPALSADKDYITVRINRRLANYIAAIAASIVFFFIATTPAVNNIISETHKACCDPLIDNNIQKMFKVSVQQEKVTQAKIAAIQNTTVADTSAANISVENTDTAKALEKEINTAEITKATKIAEASKVTDTPKTKTKKTPKTITKPNVEPAPNDNANSSIASVKQEEYAVVLASALSMKNAESYIKDLTNRGYKVCLQTGNGKMNRVIIPNFKNMDEARAKIQELKNTSDEFKNAWALKLD